MALSSELIDQLVKVTQNTEPRDKDNTAYGTVVIMGSKKYVKIDGSDLMTPVSSTVAVENGDRVIVTIKSHSATVTGNTSSPAASDKKVTELGTKISDFEIVIADKVSAKELDVQIGRIDDLTVDNATIKESLTANKAKIDDLTAKNAEITGTLEANKAKIDDLDAKKLDAEVADIKYASVDRLDATDANLRNLKSDYAQFEKTTTGELEATNAKIDGLDTKYANVDFSNIGKAAIEQFYATSGIIKDLVVGDQTITGELVGITITGDLIKGNTIVADKLVIKGSDGLYYKLNTDGVTTEKEQTEYNSLNGQIIQAKSITATKIDVKDLVAFGATIGGFNIGQDSIFSGVKETVDNKSRGIYMDKNGQIAIGDVNNYIKYFKDTDGRYRLKISAASLEFNASGDSGEESKDLETVIKDINDKVDGIAKTNKGIGSITNYYLATSESSGVTTKTAGWTTKIQNVSSSKKYLWNYEVTKYTDDTIANTTEPCIIGMYSAVGATGNGIQKITEYYALSALKDSVPTVWSENVPNLTATNKYLWNYEKILYTNGGTELTKKRIIGVYGDTGKDGAKGEDGYSPTATVSKNGDTTTITIVDKTGTHTQTVKDGTNGTPGKDGTNGKTTYFHVKYSNDGGKTFTSNSGETVGSYIGTCTNYTEADPTTVGSYVWAKIKGEKGDTGAKGVGVSSVDVMYYKSTSATSLSGGSWVTTDPGWENGKYIWSKTVITYTNKTTDESTPVCITGAKGSTGGTGAKGETGATGKGVSSIVEQYYQSTSATALSGGSWSEKYPGWTNGKYIWTRSVITYTDKTTTTTTAVCVTGAKGSDGNNGKSIGSVINYYLATSASSDVSTSTSGWTTTVQNVTLEKKYLWNYEVVKYSDGTVASTTSPCIIGTYGDTGKTGATGKNALQVLKQWIGTYTTIGQEVNCPTDLFNRIPVAGDMFTNVDASSNLGTWKITKVADGQAYFKMVSYVSAKGATGATGNGIKSIKEHYAVSTSNTVTPTSWLDDVPVTNPVNKYLWNYETITYTNGTSVDSKKRVIGVYGDTGNKGETGATGAPGKDANQVVHSVAGNGNTNQYIEFATVKVIRNYANYATTFKLSGREYETTDVQFSFVSVNNIDPGLYFLRATGGFNVWMYKKTTSTWGLVTKLNEAWGYMRVYNFQPGNDSISLTWTNTRYASLPSGCIAADQLQAAKTATNFMEFNSGTGLQIGDKTNGTWKGFRSRITSTAFEILNEAGAAVASYGRKLIQLGKDSVDAIIELCGGKGNIKYATPENNYIQQGLALDRGLIIESVDNIIIKPANKFFVNTELTDSTTDFVGRSNITPGSFQLNVWQSNKGSNIINASVGIEGNIEEGLNLEATGGKYDFLEAIRFNNISLLDWIYPVGSIYMSAKEGNPALLFGGTWVAWGAGRVPVGFNGSDGNFNSSEKTGGSKTINISHSHTVNSHKHVGATGYDENNYYSGVQWGSAVVPSSGFRWSANWSTATNPIRLSYTSPESPGTNAQLSGSQSILQPYIVCYMWKRTA